MQHFVIRKYTELPQIAYQPASSSYSVIFIALSTALYMATCKRICSSDYYTDLWHTFSGYFLSFAIYMYIFTVYACVLPHV